MTKKLMTCFVFLLAIVLVAACGGGGAESDGGGGETAAKVDTGPKLSKGTASVTGTVTYEGQPPRLAPIAMDGDPSCKEKHSEPVADERLILGDGQTMANILVRVTNGLPTGQWGVPSEAVVMDQKGCQYIPHVMGIMAGQSLKILNSDGILHNVHALPKINREFNKGMPGAVTESEVTFDKVEDSFKIKCDVHPWMGAWIAVLDHPFFNVTAEDGQYSIEGLPAGSYTVEAWHERLGTQSASVTVADGESASADFTFSRPQ